MARRARQQAGSLGAQGVRQAGRGSVRCAGGGVRGARGAQRAQRARQAGARAAGERQQARTRAERAGQG